MSNIEEIQDRVRRLSTLRTAFRSCFLDEQGNATANGKLALDEIKRFCCGDKPVLRMGATGLDPHATIAAAGRQEVYFRIAAMLELDDSDLAALHNYQPEESQ